MRYAATVHRCTRADRDARNLHDTIGAGERKSLFANCVRSLVEDNCLVPIDQYASLHMPANGSGQDCALNVTANLNQVSWRVRMCDPFDALLDNWTFIQIRGYVVRRSPDDFHPAIIGLIVWAGAFETRQERMVDVDTTPAQFCAKLGAENLHVARKNHKIDFKVGDEGANSHLLSGACFTRDRKVVIGNSAPFNKRAHFLMIGDDGRNVYGKKAGAPTVQQVVEAMTLFRHRDENSGLDSKVVKRPLHLKFGSDGGERERQGIDVHHAAGIRAKLCAHVEQVVGIIVEMVRLRDRDEMLGEKSGCCSNDAAAVGTLQNQYEKSHVSLLPLGLSVHSHDLAVNLLFTVVTSFNATALGKIHSAAHGIRRGGVSFIPQNALGVRVCTADIQERPSVPQ